MKKGRKQKKTKKPKTTQSGLSFYPCRCTIPPIKTIYIKKKNPHQGQPIKTQIKKERKKNTSNKVQLFLFGNNNNKKSHNKLTNKKLPLW